MPWYQYNGGDICSPNSYALVGSTPPICPSPNIHLCAIQASDNMTKPILTAVLICEIANALQSSNESVNVLLKP